MIISGRETNDKMSLFVVKCVVNTMKEKSIKIHNSNLLMMGLTFKENCPDIRNTKIIDLIDGFKKTKIKVDVYDPVANKDEVAKEYNIKLIKHPVKNKYDVIVVAVKHDEFKSIKVNALLKFCKKTNVVYDLKNTFPYDQRITKL